MKIPAAAAFSVFIPFQFVKREVVLSIIRRRPHRPPPRALCHRPLFEAPQFPATTTTAFVCRLTVTSNLSGKPSMKTSFSAARVFVVIVWPKIVQNEAAVSAALQYLSILSRHWKVTDEIKCNVRSGTT